MKSVILAGGSGTHLWPISRENFPKQFIKFGKYSLFQEAFLRSKKLSEINEIYIVTNVNLKFFVIGQIQEMGFDIPSENVLIEPCGKNTFPSILYAVKSIEKKFSNSFIVVFPSDHKIHNNVEIINKAKSLADRKFIVTFGIKPRYPSTNFGYILEGKKIGIGKKVNVFSEKPNKEESKKLINKGFLWNSGIFLFNISTFLKEIKKYSPKITEIFTKIEDINTIYEKIPSISFDYEILEKSENLVVVPLNNLWNDIDDFSDLYEVLNSDENGNVINDSELLSLNSKNNFIHSNKKLVSTIDLKDMIIVDTSDTLLISPKKSSNKVKEIVTRLKKNQDERVLTGNTVYRPWGYYTILESSKNHVIKKICVFPKHRLSLQLHHHRSEHWVVVNGTAEVHVNGKDFFVLPGESTFIRMGEKHRLGNPSDKISLEIIEVQLGEFISEDDIIRFDDVYGRI